MSVLEEKLSNKTSVVGIVGLGYVGLPLCVAFAQAGFRVIGFDIDQKKVQSVNKGNSYISDVSSQSLLLQVENRRFQATADQSRIKEVDVICICVPTPLTKTKEPDLTYVVNESEIISKYIHKEQLVILESTTYPGTTREVVEPILERSGLKSGLHFFLAFSPEKVDPGNIKYSLKNTPKVVGGVDSESTRLATLFYRHVADVVLPVSSAEVAEMVKVFENVFRNVNIALVNELAQLCEAMGLSVWEVIDTASSKPFGYMPFYPGPGVGGHCIPLDPYYLASKAKEYDFHTRFIELAAEINERMPYVVTTRIVEALNACDKSIKGAKLLVLGITFKKDVADDRESPILKMINLLEEKGAQVSYNDPYIPQIKNSKKPSISVELTEERLSSADCVIIGTDHSLYEYQNIVDSARLVFDTRGITRNLKNKNILRLGEGKHWTSWEEREHILKEPLKETVKEPIKVREYRTASNSQ
ncbi:MAG: nucleotide sugar dehydrogenase [Paludibacter sp.]|nr:nucleotide sugar dehydrogenase [Paludibacter sp.]